MYLRYAVTAYGLFRKILPGYAAAQRIRRSTDCHAGMCGIRYGYRIFHCLLKRSAFHRHTGNDGDRLWYRTYRNQCNTARRLCRAVHERI